MPKSLLAKNLKEIFLFTDFKPNQVAIYDGTPKQRADIITNPDIVVLLMGFQRQSEDWEKLLTVYPNMTSVVIDEFHLGGYKNPQSKRSTEMFRFARRQMTNFHPMDGSLIAGRLDSCYSAIHVVEPRYYAGHAAFLGQHAIMDDYRNVLGWTNHAKLGRIFLRHGVRHTFESIYGKQTPKIIKESVEVDPRCRKVYSTFEETALLELDDMFLEGKNPAVATMRCRQLLAHPHSMGIPGWDGNQLTGKEERLEVLVSDHMQTGKPFIVYAALIPEQERVHKLLTEWGFKAALINSNVPQSKRGQIDVDFQNGKYDCIVGSPATASVGFNWGHVDHIIYMSIDYEDTNFSQAYKRAIRGVRKTPLLISLMEYENTIEQRILFIVDKKSRDLHKVDPTYEILQLSKL